MSTNKYISSCLFFFIFLILVSGCALSSGTCNSQHCFDGLIDRSYELADSLEGNLSTPLTDNPILIVASFANIDDLEESSTFGRMVAEQISSRLAQKGYNVIELKLRTKSVFVKHRNGEFILSRDISEVSKKHNVSAVVVGTYGKISDRTYVSAKIIDPNTHFIISSKDIYWPRLK